MIIFALALLIGFPCMLASQLARQDGVMVIRGNYSEYISLTPLFSAFAAGENSSPAIYLSGEIDSHGFRGATEPDEPMISIPVAALRQFVEDLRVLEQDRRGKATLMGRNPREFSLSIRIHDRAGHTLLAAELGVWMGGYPHSVAVAFEIDPTSLPTILSDFEDLLAFPDPTQPVPFPPNWQV